MNPVYGLRSALSLAIGVGSVIAGSYLVSRIKEKQDVENRLDRLESVVDKMATAASAAQQQKKAPSKSSSRRSTKSSQESKK